MRNTLKLTEARQLTPPADPVTALQSNLQLAMLGSLTANDMHAVAEKLKTLALQGDLKAINLLMKLITPAPTPAESMVVNQVNQVSIDAPAPVKLPGPALLAQDDAFYRREAARLIARDGPAGIKELARVVGCSEVDLLPLLKDHAWFELEQDGWHLTTLGHQQVKEIPDE